MKYSEYLPLLLFYSNHLEPLINVIAYRRTLAPMWRPSLRLITANLTITMHVSLHLGLISSTLRHTS